MKRLFCITLMAVFIAVQAFAAGTVVVSSDNVQDVSGEPSLRTVTISCTGDATDGSIPDTTLSTSGVSGLERPLQGWWLFRVIIDNDSGDTGVTDDSDVYLKDSWGNDYMGGQGVDKLDDDTNNKINMSTIEAFYDDPTLDVDNQSVTGAVYTIEMVLTK